MNTCGVHQNAEINRTSDHRDAVMVCPKPRRVGVLNHHLARSLRWQVSHQMELCDSNSRSEILDLILTKSDGGGCEQDLARTVTSSSPPLFFSGSPPSRVSNPLTKDSLFKDEFIVMSPPPLIPRATKPPSPRNGGGGGCVRVNNFDNNNPSVRVVGFNCDRRGSNRSIPTLA